MDEERTTEIEKLYAQGMEQFRTAQWSVAVETLSELRALSSAYPEVDTLIADALLKIEVERSMTPDGVAPPKQLKFLSSRFLSAVLALMLIGGVLLIAFRPADASAPVANNVAQPIPVLPRPRCQPRRPSQPRQRCQRRSPRPARSRCAWPQANRWCEPPAILRSFLM